MQHDRSTEENKKRTKKEHVTEERGLYLNPEWKVQTYSSASDCIKC